MKRAHALHQHRIHSLGLSLTHLLSNTSTTPSRCISTMYPGGVNDEDAHVVAGARAMMRYRNTGTRNSVDGGVPTGGGGLPSSAIGPQTPGTSSAPGSNKNWNIGDQHTRHQHTYLIIIPPYSRTTFTHPTLPSHLFLPPTGAGIAGGGGGAVQGMSQAQSGGQGSKYPALGSAQGTAQGQAGGQGLGAAYTTSASNYNAAIMAQQVCMSLSQTQTLFVLSMYLSDAPYMTISPLSHHRDQHITTQQPRPSPQTQQGRAGTAGAKPLGGSGQGPAAPPGGGWVDQRPRSAASGDPPHLSPIV